MEFMEQEWDIKESAFLSSLSYDSSFVIFIFLSNDCLRGENRKLRDITMSQEAKFLDKFPLQGVTHPLLIADEWY